MGFFKQTVYSIGLRYVNYFIEAGILTKAKVTRMAEAEMAADLFVALLDKVQTNKGIEAYYKKYEDNAGNLEEIEKRFDKVMTFIGSIYKAEELKNTNYSRTQLFYSLFTSIAHLHYGLEGPNKNLRKTITEKSFGKIRVALDNVSARYDEIADNLDAPEHPKAFKEFINASRRGTTDTGSRILRTNFLSKQILEVI